MERLNEILSCIGNAGVVADIGCDHGKLEGMLLRSGRAQKVIATDISEKSLHKAVMACTGSVFEGRVEFRLGDGLAVLAPGEADVIVIAGMGGEQMADILKRGLTAARTAKLVLCPHSHEGRLRRFLLENGYFILQESLAMEEGRYYQILCAGHDGNAHSQKDDFFYEIGFKLLQSGHPLLRGFLESKLAKTNKIIANAARSDKENAAKQAKKLSAFAKRLEEQLK
jgi:tRNA (adenine22-N1)-methyltransferase